MRKPIRLHYARALGAAGGIAYWLGDYPGASGFYNRALVVARGLDDRRLLAEALSDVALTEADIGDSRRRSRQRRSACSAG